MSVFIGYNTQDERYEHKIVRAFTFNEMPYGFAPKDIKSGENFADKIAEALRKHRATDVYDKMNEDYQHLTSVSAELFLLILSRHSMDSNWVKKELIRAFDSI